MSHIYHSNNFNELTEKIYEYSFFIEDIKFIKNKFSILMHSHDISDRNNYLLKIKPEPIYINWGVSQSVFKTFLSRKEVFVITNAQLIRSYRIELQYTFLLEGWPDWSIYFKFKKNVTPIIEFSLQNVL